MDLNKVMIIGRLTTDIEVKKIWDSGNSVVNFSIATNRKYKTKDRSLVEESEFHRCVAYSQIADLIWKYLWKWKKVYLEWRLKTRQWEDQAWNKRYTTEIVIENIIFLDSNPNAQSYWNSWDSGEAAPKTWDSKEEDVPF